MLDLKTADRETVLNRIFLIADGLRYLADKRNGTREGSMLKLLGEDLEECLLVLDRKEVQ
jgi:hypothetical protein